MVDLMRIASLALVLVAGCYQSHGLAGDRADAAVAVDAPIAPDAGSCGGETDVSLFLVRSVGAGSFLDLTSAAVVGFGECGTGAIVFGFDADPGSSAPLLQITIPVTDAPIDREGDWPCTVRVDLGPGHVIEESCVLSGRITGYAYRGFYVQLSGMLGGVGYSVGGELSAPACDLQICP